MVVVKLMTGGDHDHDHGDDCNGGDDGDDSDGGADGGDGDDDGGGDGGDEVGDSDGDDDEDGDSDDGYGGADGDDGGDDVDNSDVMIVMVVMMMVVLMVMVMMMVVEVVVAMVMTVNIFIVPAVLWSLLKTFPKLTHLILTKVLWGENITPALRVGSLRHREANVSCPMLHRTPGLDTDQHPHYPAVDDGGRKHFGKNCLPSGKDEMVILSDWWLCSVCPWCVPRLGIQAFYGAWGGALREGGEGLERTAPNCMHSEWFQGKTEHFGLNIKKKFNPTDPGWG